MSLDRKPLDSVSAQDLQELVDDQVIEQKTLEYKRDLPGKTDSDRKEFLCDVSSFANTASGHIVYGIREEDGKPAEVIGGAPWPIQVRRLPVSKTCCETDLDHGFRGSDSPSSNSQTGSNAMVIRVPSSWAKPLC